MIIQNINDNEYEIQLYDWIEKHDYIFGHVKRQQDEEEDSDLRHWMFYPIGENKPIVGADLQHIWMFIDDLNK